jgi:DNA-directed RNA polymerase II subunit RPB1
MNMHVPQSTQAQMELKYLAAVQHHFISPSSNSPIISPSQDNLLGVYKITADDVELTQTEATHLLSGTDSFNGILPEPELREGKRLRWTGKQIYSVILPPITLKIGKLLVENGIVKSGQVSKKESAGIMQAIHSEFGATETARYINDLQYITSRFLIKTGFSVGVSDMLLHPDLQKKNHDRIVKVFEDEVELMRKVHLNILDDKGTGDFASVFEGEARKLLKTADDEIMKQTSDTLSPQNNRVKFMVSSGAKGKAFNIKQMMCLLGQQDIEGSRVPIGFTDRTLPHYPRYENGLESRGFITGNFIEGLNPQEYFFHAIAGRIGLIDTAVKTAKSGYLQRRLVKMMEDMRACHDNSVRDGNNNIIEFCYGADGFDGMKLESQKTHFKLIDSEKLLNDYIITEEDGNTMKEYVLARVVTKMKKDNSNWYSKCQSYNKMVQRCLDLLHVEMVKLNNGVVIDSLKFPANIPKLIAKAKSIYGLEDCKVKSNMNFLDVIERLEQCMDDCMVNGDRNNVLMILLCDHLSPKKVLRDYNFNKDALEYVCSQIYLGFQRGLINPGEMVGPVAAQSIGEQSTQMTLNTFHSAGSGASVTAGVPRMEEILSVTSNPKNPSNILYLKSDSMFNKDKAEVIKNSISQITIGEILKNDPEFYLEPTNKIENVLEEDRAFMKFYEVFTEMEDGTKDIKNNPWVIRLEFDRKEMINHNISMSDIHLIMSMQSEYSDAVLMYSDDNSGKLVFRIKMPFESKQEVEDDIKLLKGKVEEIKGIIIKGVDNINKAFVNNIEDPEDNNNYYHIKGKKSTGQSKTGDTYTSKKEYVVTTEGSNLFELLIKDDIDETRSYSIEPNEMWSIFGIEACKFVIQQQFFKVFADSGAFTNPRHICLLVNKMCHDGEPHAISIYGVAKEDIGPLAKASFERPVEFFKNAALFGEVDELKGVSANIMMGQIANAGTGSVRCYLDEEALAEGLKRKGLTKASIEDTEITEAELLKQFEQRICVSEEDKIKINMTDVQEDGINLDMIPTVQVE